jgi:ribosomal-protein-serine acetyltransferase
MLNIPHRNALRTLPLATERLTIAPIDASDAHELWLAVNGSRAALERYLPWVPFQTDPVSSQRFAQACMDDWDQQRALRFVIRERVHRSLAGVVGLENCSHLHRSCELGYWLRNESTGRGLMREAARACVSFAFEQLGAHRVRVAAATDNHRSLAVIHSLGFRFEGIARQAERCDERWLDHAVFALLATDER